MTTPMYVFLQIAEKYGHVDIKNMEAVLHFYEHDFEALPDGTAGVLLDELLGKMTPDSRNEVMGGYQYSKKQGLPSLAESPPLDCVRQRLSESDPIKLLGDILFSCPESVSLYFDFTKEFISAGLNVFSREIPFISDTSSDMKGIIPEQIVAANKANIEALLTLANTAFASAERIAALNLNTARAVLEDTVASAKALMAAKDVQELITLQTSLAQPAVEKAVAYSRSVYEISSQTQEEVSKLVEAQVAEANKSFAAALDKAAKSAPAGSDVAIAAVKSAIAAASSAYDSVTKAAKQVAEIAEANVAAATSATAKAVETDKALALAAAKFRALESQKKAS